MVENKQFGNSEQLDCSDCVNHGGDWDCNHVQCRKGADTISRQAVLRVLNRNMSNGFYDYNHDWWDPTIDMEAINEIKALPSTQKKGHWIDEGTNYACSECHRGCWVNSNYCPWCGADMRGEDDE